ncbi:MAG: beta-mannosidase [Lachnospiraceae bacterium]|nr:beta-mannosidase [Lachnospiraceae bacterium]
MSDKISTPTNPESQVCVHRVMKYLSDITYERIVTGQHTQTMEQAELHMIRRLTGKEPALLGFELLSYSPNINYLDTDEVCMKEVLENYGTLKRAWEWAEKRGLITFTWHWFSPLGGRSKSFFTENTDFDASRAVIEGTPENLALLSDMDMMAGLLRPFCDKGVPILWRPFHEGDGDWFWWGVKGPEVVKKLWRMMYERYTKVHRLNNLIWVWNTAVPECYPGDDVVDIISRDLYPDKHVHTACEKEYQELIQITKQPKITLLGETGSLPDVNAIHDRKAGWASYMTWSGIFCLVEDFNRFAYLKELYSSPYAVTKEELPELYTVG